jgi:protein-disulfide isomerase
MKREMLSNLFTGILVLCALTVTGLLVRRELFAPPAAAAAPDIAPRPLADWTSYQSAGQRMGPASAPITVVEFSDFQCPFCARFAQTLRELQARHPGRVQVLYRHYPLQSIHPYATAAAVASECAGRQGRFGQLHDLMFAQQDSVGVRAWGSFAREAGVTDLDAFERCLVDADARARVAQDMSEGERAEIKVTPTIIANGKLIPGALDLAALEAELFGKKGD